MVGVVATLLARVHLLLPNLVRKNEVLYFTNEPPTPVLLERWGCGEDAISPTKRLVEMANNKRTVEDACDYTFVQTDELPKRENFCST